MEESAFDEAVAKGSGTMAQSNFPEERRDGI